MKDLCAKYGIPSAAYATFTDPAEAKAYIRQQVRRVTFVTPLLDNIRHDTTFNHEAFIEPVRCAK